MVFKMHPQGIEATCEQSPFTLDTACEELLLTFMTCFVVLRWFAFIRNEPYDVIVIGNDNIIANLKLFVKLMFLIM